MNGKNIRPALNRVTAEVISCPGQLWDDSYWALQINLEGLESPYVLTLSLSALGYKALSEQSNPLAVYQAVASAVNNANVLVEVLNRPKRPVCHRQSLAAPDAG